MDSTIKADLYRYEKYSGIKGFIKAMFIPGFQYTYFMRKSSKYKKYSPLGTLYRIILHIFSIKYGFQIPVSTKIGEGFYIGHFGHIIINGEAIIGKNCNIAPGVIIGRTNRGEKKGKPIIGDNVWIGANTVIVGKISIGSNVLIAPNSFVNIDIPDNSIVIGGNIKIIKNINATLDYINNVLEF